MNEVITVTDGAEVAPPVNLAVNESVRVSDVVEGSSRVGPVEPVNLEVAEPIRVRDAARARPPIPLTVAESVSVHDAAAVLPPAVLHVSEKVRVRDSAAVEAPVQLGVAETVAVADAVKVLPPVEVGVTEPIAVADAVDALPPVELGVVESIAVGDALAVLPPVELDVGEPLAVTDSVDLELSVHVPVSETITVSDVAGISPDIRARFGTDSVRAATGDTVDVPLLLTDYASDRALAGYAARMAWDPDRLEFVGVRPGTGAPELDDTGAADGMVTVSGEKIGDASSTTTLVHLLLRVAADVTPGSAMALELELSRLVDRAGNDVIPETAVVPAGLCVRRQIWGDIDGDGAVGSADAVGILRAAAGTGSDSASLELGDVNGDGRLTNQDALLSLEDAVGIPSPGTRVGRNAVDACASDELPAESIGKDPASQPAGKGT